MEKDKNSEKITLPKELQIKMLEFFMRTSIPRKMREKNERAYNASINKKG